MGPSKLLMNTGIGKLKTSTSLAFNEVEKPETPLGTLEPAKRDEALKSCLSAGLSFAGGGTMPAVTVGSSSSAFS